MRLDPWCTMLSPPTLSLIPHAQRSFPTYALCSVNFADLRIPQPRTEQSSVLSEACLLLSGFEHQRIAHQCFVLYPTHPQLLWKGLNAAGDALPKVGLAESLQRVLTGQECQAADTAYACALVAMI